VENSLRYAHPFRTAVDSDSHKLCVTVAASLRWTIFKQPVLAFASSGCRNLHGVQAVNVALLQGTAEVKYNAADVSAETIAEEIDDTGFEAAVLEVVKPQADRQVGFRNLLVPPRLQMRQVEEGQVHRLTDRHSPMHR
jgi:hypothetical protein